MVWSSSSMVSASGYSVSPNHDTVVPFPSKPAQASQDQVEIIDPGIRIMTDDGRVLEKLGMSGSECCYILLPDVHQVTFCYQQDVTEGVALSRDAAAAVIEKIIVSEADAVSEISMSCPDPSDPATVGDMRWIEPGRTLFLARKSPGHVALLSVQLAKQ